MRKVYALGESLIDIIFNQQDVKAARAGGSMLNSAISLGRAGVDINFLSEFGVDQGGSFLSEFLNQNHVKTDHVFRYNDGKTPLALAFLNEKGDASYEFYKQYPKNRLQLALPEFTSNDIFLFGSFFGIDPDIRSNVINVVKKAREQDAMIVYDPNFRKPHAHQLEMLRPMILENMGLADVIRASNEDLKIIFGESNHKKLTHVDQLMEKPLIITHNASGIYLNTSSNCAFFPTQKIDVVSTIGAGDNFNAGTIYGLLKFKINTKNLNSITAEKWEKILKFGSAFAGNVCQSYDNYISAEFAAELKNSNL
jgi:fructokinase